MNLLKIDNLPQIDNEIFEIILQHKNVKIEKIVSNTIKTPKKFCEEQDEFVVLLKGCAKLEINGSIKKLKAGDFLFIPAKTPHTLLKTKKTAIWLAIFIA
jgi:cupin 2 domain-containing protein